MHNWYQGEHAALSHRVHDPVVALAQIICTVQSVISRNVPPNETTVISVTQIAAGDAINVVPERTQLQGTIRTFSPEVRERVLTRFRDVVEQTASLMECEVSVNLELMAPAVINDPEVVTRLHNGLTKAAGDYTLKSDFGTMASEDVAYFLEAVPGAFFLVGSANADRGLDFPHHHPRFDFDEEALVIGTQILASAVSEFVMSPLP